jgi:hypothetical protein
MNTPETSVDEAPTRVYFHPTIKKVGEVSLSEGGITIREYFACQALLAFLSGSMRPYADALIEELAK